MTADDRDTNCPLCGRVDHHEHSAEEWADDPEWRRASTMLGTPPWLHRPGDGCHTHGTQPHRHPDSDHPHASWSRMGVADQEATR